MPSRPSTLIAVAAVASLIAMTGAVSAQQQPVADGFTPTQQPAQYPNYMEIVGTSKIGATPAAETVIHCGLTADGNAFSGFSSIYTQTQKSPEVSVETRIIDNVVLATTPSPLGAKTNQPWAVQTLSSSGKVTANICAWDSTTDTLGNCAPAASFFQPADLQNQSASLMKLCAGLMQRPDVQSSLTHVTDPSRDKVWQTFISNQRQMLRTLGQ